MDIFAQITDELVYGIFVKRPYLNDTLVNAGEINIMQARAFSTEYALWRNQPVTRRTWASFQTWWKNSYDMKQETDTTVVSLGYGGSVTDVPTYPEAHAAADADHKDMVNNFGTVFTDNSAAFSNLAEANHHLGSNVSVSVT